MSDYIYYTVRTGKELDWLMEHMESCDLTWADGTLPTEWAHSSLGRYPLSIQFDLEEDTIRVGEYIQRISTEVSELMDGSEKEGYSVYEGPEVSEVMRKAFHPSLEATGWELVTFVEAMKQLEYDMYILRVERDGIIYEMSSLTDFVDLDRIAVDFFDLIHECNWYVYK